MTASSYFRALAEFPPPETGMPGCTQVCIGLVVAEGGIPVGYEIFPGNTGDVTTVRQIVGAMESRYVRAERVWVMDPDMIPSENMEFLRGASRRYFVGTLRGELKWTALSIHMVDEHGFYGGRGSTYRVNPEAARRILEL